MTAAMPRWIGVVVLAAACSDPSPPVEMPPDGPPVQPRVETVIDVAGNRALDLLFVVDNSGTMSEEQQALAAAFPSLIDAIAPAQLDLHVGVVTSDVGVGRDIIEGSCRAGGDDGALQAQPACGIDGNFLRDVDDGAGGRDTNYPATGTLSDAFGCIAQVGIDGCGFEQHLEAMRLALGGHPANAGFLRAEAKLAVVIVADEDDCSASDLALFGPESAALGRVDSFRCFRFGVTCDQADPTAPGLRTGCAPSEPSTYLRTVTEYVSFLRGLKDPADVVVTGIFGDATPVEVVQLSEPTARPDLLPACTYPGPSGVQTADPAVRLSAFVDRFPGARVRSNICTGDLGQSLAAIGSAVTGVASDRCLGGTLVDTDAGVAGIQPGCEVTIDDSSVVMPACDAGATVTPCWRAVSDVRCAFQPSSLALELVGAGAIRQVHARCLGQ